jgi:hypothetical protein
MKKTGMNAKMKPGELKDIAIGSPFSILRAEGG